MTSPPLERLLYVEDEPDIRAVARVALEVVGGFRLFACASGAEAIHALAERRVEPQLILLDVMMPDLDGPATFRGIRAVPGLEATPIAFMTAKMQRHELAELRALGAVGIVAKPFNPMTLADEIRALWAGLPAG